ncbi:unnamed protein product, partial [Amoebophrya sp. A25]
LIGAGGPSSSSVLLEKELKDETADHEKSLRVRRLRPRIDGDLGILEPSRVQLLDESHHNFEDLDAGGHYIDDQEERMSTAVSSFVEEHVVSVG